MPKPPEKFFQHMVLAIDEIEQFISGYSYKQFTGDNKTISAVIRQLEIIGEAAGRIPKDLVSDSPIAWDKITSMRHKLIHDYFGVDVDIVWKTATEGLDELRQYLRKKI